MLLFEYALKEVEMINYTLLRIDDQTEGYSINN